MRTGPRLTPFAPLRTRTPPSSRLDHRPGAHPVRRPPARHAPIPRCPRRATITPRAEQYERCATWKHLLQHKTETTETFGTYCCNICVKHMQHLDKKNDYNIRLEIDEIFWTNTYNMLLKHLQHPPIYFCNIKMKQLQHTSKTSETLET